MITLLVITGFFVQAIHTGGLTQQCVYNVNGSIYTLTISVSEVCPVTITENDDADEDNGD